MGGAGATMVTLAVATTLPSPPAAAVAVIVTIGLAVGTVAGAVKVAVAPLAVWAGEIEPQGVREGRRQSTVQFTPAFVVSLATVAMTVAVPFVYNVLGGS